MAIIFLCAVVFCVALAFAAAFGRRIEGTLALSVMFLISLLYFSGFYGNLLWGVYACVFCAAVSSGYLVYCAVKKNMKISKHLSPYLAFFIVFVLWLYHNYHGMVLSEWDEFTHWGLSTKIMYDSDLFSNQPGLTCYFVDYLPGTALFQYLLQKLNREYAEWCSVLAQGIFVAVFPFAFLEKIDISKKNLIPAGIAALAVFLLPEGFYLNAYRILYVDTSLAVVFAYALFCHFSAEKRDAFYFINLSAAFGILCIIKPSGIGLMALAAVIITGDNLISGRFPALWKKRKFALLAVEVLPFLTGWFYKFLWQLRLDALGYAAHFDTGRITFSAVWDVLSGKGEQYQKDTLANFYNAFVGMDKTKISTGSLICYLFVFALLLYFIIRFRRQERKRWMLFAGLSSACFIIYSLYMLALYLFTYSPDEAVGLASFNRYEYTVILGLILPQVLLLFVFLVNHPKGKCYQVFCVLICILFMVPNDISLKIDNGEELSAKQELRKNYEIADRVREKLSVNDKVWLISNGSDGYDYWVLRYNLSPVHAQTRDYSQPYGEVSWDIGTRYEGEAWARTDMAPAEWMERLITEGCNYVLLYHIDDNFKTEYAELFQDGNPSERQLYFVNRETGKFEMVDM
ncbi:hypothetical protein D7V82_14950 [bacterium 1xD8-6]|jgi:hypothetical protein|nr:hypothetical protein D7V72_11805 [bacterium D16-36]RKI66453.1 hypothetical protein D7V82_14950 [bacterium 1xD8-6]